MSVEPQDAGDPPAPLSVGRPKVYPYDTMNVGQMFFIAGAEPKSVSSHAYRRGAELGRKFSIRAQWMVRTPHGWEPASEGVPNAVAGVGVYRVE